MEQTNEKSESKSNFTLYVNLDWNDKQHREKETGFDERKLELKKYWYFVSSCHLLFFAFIEKYTYVSLIRQKGKKLNLSENWIEKNNHLTFFFVDECKISYIVFNFIKKSILCFFDKIECKNI